MGAAKVTFTAAGVRQGLIRGQALGAGVFVYGLVFGVLASERGLSLLQAALMSLLVYSGTAQLAALQSWGSSPMVLPLVASVLVINARYLLYGAAIQPWLSKVSRKQAYISLFVLGDSNWALSMREYALGARDAGFVLGSGLSNFSFWMVGTLLGNVLAGGVPNPQALGLDFMLVAFAAAISIEVWRSKADIWPALAAAAVAWALHRWVPGGWYIVGAGLAGAAVGAWRHVD
ncbi:MAG: AzlC family ABC transporter permease [Burkholderiaceae bacterium]|nr:AzlC family ABC transporter permease [Burkholderiaceae bacterium]